MNNRTKSILSVVSLIFFSLIAGGSLDDLIVIFWIIVVVCVIAIIYAIYDQTVNEPQRKEERKEKEDKKKQKKEDKKQRLINSIGKYSKLICYNWDSFIIINEEDSKLLLNENVYNFMDILDFKVSDNEMVVYSPTISKTKTNTGSMLGRAIVGGVLTGGVGALVGGATAKRTTVTDGGTSTVSHNYKIIVTVNSISNPSIILNIGSEEDATNEIGSLLNVIIARNQNIDSYIADKEDVCNIKEAPVVKDFSSEQCCDNATMQLILNALKNGRKLEAVKIMKENTNMGLKEAKDYIDNLADNL